MKTLLVTVLALFAASCSSTQTKVATSPWYGDNEAKLNAMVKQYGNTGNNYDSRHRPVATFDWDNTVLKNDAGDATFYWMISHDLVKTPKAWKKTSPFLNGHALQALAQTCKTRPQDKTLKTSTQVACADLLLSIYDGGKLPKTGETAWKTKNVNADTVNPAYAWFTSLLAGYTPDEVRAFTQSAMMENLSHAPESIQKIGSKNYTAWVRFYTQMKDLIQKLQQNGFDVWIVSASPQPIVEVYAKEIGIDANHVIGIRPLLQKNIYSADLEGCGTYADKTNAIITYRQGKRCFINKIIFGVTDPKQMMDQPSRTIFAAGDSDTDVFFVKDAKHHLVINRNNVELMCNAYENRDGNWLINPMFIGSKPQKKGSVTGEPAYSCEKFGLSNQAVDTVFGQ